MTRSFALALTLTLLPGLALAQDEAPPAEPKPAGTAVAEALVKLRGAKQLARLTQTRRYSMRHRGGVFLLELSGAEAGPVLKLQLKIKSFSRRGSIVFAYELGSDGKLRALEVKATRERNGKQATATVRGTRGEGKLSLTKLKDGAPDGKPSEMPWSDNHLGAVFLWFIVPSLFDQGLPRTLNPDVLQEERLRPGRKTEATTFTRTTEKPVKDESGVLVHDFESQGKHDRTKVVVAADGPDKGKILRLQVGKSRTFRLVSAKEYAQLEKDAPLLANEGKALGILRRLRYAQDDYWRSKNAYAKTMDLLEARDKYFAKQLEEVQAVYLVLLRAAPDGSKWMAIAVPNEPGKTGRHYFVTNQDGKVYQSDTKLELADSCAIPKGAKPVE